MHIRRARSGGPASLKGDRYRGLNLALPTGVRTMRDGVALAGAITCAIAAPGHRCVLSSSARKALREHAALAQVRILKFDEADWKRWDLVEGCPILWVLPRTDDFGIRHIHLLSLMEVLAHESFVDS